MREIKVRAWHQATKSWLKITGFETDISDDDKTASINTGLGGMFHDGDYIGCFEDRGYKDGNGVILVQYTGLKDKNGKEIFEGDILKFEHLKDYAHELQVVTFDKWMFGTDDFAFSEIVERNYDFEVVGNIYENKDLIK